MFNVCLIFPLRSCDFTFKDMKGILVHCHQHLKQLQKLSTSPPLACPTCRLVADSAPSLKRHYFTEHLVKGPESKPVPGSKVFVCPN